MTVTKKCRRGFRRLPPLGSPSVGRACALQQLPLDLCSCEHSPSTLHLRDRSYRHFTSSSCIEGTLKSSISTATFSLVKITTTPITRSHRSIPASLLPPSPCSSQPYFPGIAATKSIFYTKRMETLWMTSRPLEGLRAMSTMAGGGGGSMKVLYDGKCPICVFEIKVLLLPAHCLPPSIPPSFPPTILLVPRLNIARALFMRATTRTKSRQLF